MAEEQANRVCVIAALVDEVDVHLAEARDRNCGLQVRQLV